MTVSAADRRSFLDQLALAAAAEIVRLWLASERLAGAEFAAYIVDGFPDVVIPYHQAAAQISATLFEEDFPSPQYQVIQADPVPDALLRKSAVWALANREGRRAVDAMSGTAQKTIYNGDRDTTIANAVNRGMRWVRVARSNACAFCRMVASRTTVLDNLYVSKAAAEQVVSSRRQVKRPLGEKYHDGCHCTAKAIPAGADPMAVLSSDEPQFVELAHQWQDEYAKARANAGTGDLNKILAAWRQQGVN